jgi:hypothetical protein
MYTVRIPFRVPPSTRIAENEAKQTQDHVEITLNWEGYYHVVKARGFASVGEANEFAVRAHAAFAWLLLQKGIAASTSLEPQKIVYSADSVETGCNIARSFGMTDGPPIDAIIDGARTAVYPSSKNIRVGTAFPADVYTRIPSEAALDVLIEGSGFAGSARVQEDLKLAVALSLYAAYFTEESPKARFLTLIMAFEALAKATQKASIALELLDRWRAELSELRSRLPAESEEDAALESLERELLFRKEDSVRSQIRKLVLLALAPAEDARERARDAVRLYDLRSTLVHEGFLDGSTLDRATQEAKELVHRTLLARFHTLCRGALPA